MTTPGAQALATELAVWNAAQVRRFGRFVETPTGPIVDTDASPFAQPCWTLWELGCATATNDEGGQPRDDHGAPPIHHFRLAQEPAIRAALAGKAVSPRAFTRLIGDFASLHEVTPDVFALTRRLFRSDLPRPLLDAFIDAGYLSCNEEGCLWLDPMAERIAWGAPSKSWQTEEESQARRLRTYGPVWKTMPASIKNHVIDGGRLDPLRLPDAIRRFWDGAAWQREPLPDWHDQKRLVDAMRIADEIKRLVEERRLRLSWADAIVDFFRNTLSRPNRGK
jgi:hypothetical protein